MMLSPLTGYCWTVREIETEKDNRQLAAVLVLVREIQTALEREYLTILRRPNVRLSVIRDAAVLRHVIHLQNLHCRAETLQQMVELFEAEQLARGFYEMEQWEEYRRLTDQIGKLHESGCGEIASVWKNCTHW